MFIIGIAGGSGSGKTTLVNSILERVPYDQISLLTQDSYYKDSSHLPIEQRRVLNFDHPDAIEWELMMEHIQLLKSDMRLMHHLLLPHLYPSTRDGEGKTQQDPC